MNKQNAITLGVALLVIVCGAAGYYVYSKGSLKAVNPQPFANPPKVEEAVVIPKGTAKPITGSVMAQFEGVWRMMYAILPSSPVSSEIIDLPGAVESKGVKISDQTSDALVYFTFEGGRGFTAQEYVTYLTEKQKITFTDVKKVTTDVPNYVSTSTSRWYQAQSDNGSIMWYIGETGEFLTVVRGKVGSPLLFDLLSHTTLRTAP